MRAAWRIAAAAAMLAWAAEAWAGVTVGALFSEHMVLQRGVPVAVWGNARAGEAVTVRVAGREAACVAGADGRWRVTLGAMEAGGPYEMTVTGDNTAESEIRIGDVLVGEVWVTSGQSNMEFRLPGAADGAAAVAGADAPTVRHFNVPHAPSTRPSEEVAGRWAVCTPEEAKAFSAVPYYFGRHLAEALGVPVGIVNTSFSGSPAEAWIPREVLEAGSGYGGIFDRERKYAAEYPAALEKFRAERARIAATNPSGASKLKAPVEPGKWQRNPSLLFNGMVRPLQPYTVRGVAWYQGESNAERGWQYRRLLADLIGSWRSGWGAAELPVLVVQLPNFERAGPDPAGAAWAELRESQAVVARDVPGVYLAVTIDIGEAKNLHPTNKREVARRLGLLAERHVYGRDVQADAPVFERMEVSGRVARVTFRNAATLSVRGGGSPRAFAVAGEDRKFHPAAAVVEGGTVVVSSPEVKAPVAVRYGWASAPECDLVGPSGLPVMPFRTDDWPALTVGVE